MVFIQEPTAGPGGGLQPVSVRLHDVWNRTGAALVEGELVKMDLAAASSEIDGTDNDNLTPDATNNPFNTVTTYATADQTAPGLVFLICEEADGLADNSRGSFLLMGFTKKALVTGTTIAIGEVLGPGIGGDLDDTAGAKAYARYMDVAGTVANAQRQVYFDGTGATIPGNHA